MPPSDLPLDDAGVPRWYSPWAGCDFESPVAQRLISHLAPSDAPFREIPPLVLFRPDVLVMDVHERGGATLRRYTADGEWGGASIHRSLRSASDDVAQEYGESIVGPWQPVPGDELDAAALAVRQADALRGGRPLGPPADMMLLEEWQRSEDVPALVRALRAGWRGPGADVVRLTNRYLLASCRSIWQLLPLEASRRGVEVAERFLDGRATREQLGVAEYQAEGAAFSLDVESYDLKFEDPEENARFLQHEAERRALIARLVKDIEAIPPDEIRRMAGIDPRDPGFSTHRLLADAAYFADSAIWYSTLHARQRCIQAYKAFLSAARLRAMVGDAFCPR